MEKDDTRLPVMLPRPCRRNGNANTEGRADNVCGVDDSLEADSHLVAYWLAHFFSTAATEVDSVPPSAWPLTKSPAR